MGLLYTKMKVFHYPDHLAVLPEKTNIILPPLHVRIKPTNACNHDCWYCAYRMDSLQLGQDMSMRDKIPRNKMLEIVDDLVEMGVRAVTFSGGGEPFVYPHLLETVRRLSDTDIKFASLTNGSRLRGEIAEHFAHKGTWIRVSIDGWDNISYAAARRVSENEFSKVMGNMESFKKLGGPCNLGVVIVVDNRNASHVYEIIKRFRDIGVDSVKIAPAIVSNDGTASNAYHRPHFTLVREQVMRATADFRTEHFEIFNAYHEQLTTFEKDYTWCPYIQIQPVIGADLNIYSCHDKAYNLEEGLLFSISGQRFKDGWYSNKSKFFKINPMVHCNHHCVVNDKNKMILEYLNLDREHLAFV